MFNFLKNGSNVFLSLFGKIIIRPKEPDGFLSPDTKNIFIGGPGEGTFIPNIAIVGFTRNPIMFGKPKGWKSQYLVTNITKFDGEVMKKFDSEDISFEYCRGTYLKEFPDKRTEIEDAWVIENVFYKCSQKPMKISAAPMYDKHGNYSTPEIFVLGVAAMISMAQKMNPEPESAS